jgi:hypothetical protein
VEVADEAAHLWWPQEAIVAASRTVWRLDKLSFTASSTHMNVWTSGYLFLLGSSLGLM